MFGNNLMLLCYLSKLKLILLSKPLMLSKDMKKKTVFNNSKIKH